MAGPPRFDSTRGRQGREVTRAPPRVLPLRIVGAHAPCPTTVGMAALLRLLRSGSLGARSGELMPDGLDCCSFPPLCKRFTASFQVLFALSPIDAAGSPLVRRSHGERVPAGADRPLSDCAEVAGAVVPSGVPDGARARVLGGGGRAGVRAVLLDAAARRDAPTRRLRVGGDRRHARVDLRARPARLGVRGQPCRLFCLHVGSWKATNTKRLWRVWTGAGPGPAIPARPHQFRRLMRLFEGLTFEPRDTRTLPPPPPSLTLSPWFLRVLIEVQRRLADHVRADLAHARQPPLARQHGPSDRLGEPHSPREERGL